MAVALFILLIVPPQLEVSSMRTWIFWSVLFTAMSPVPRTGPGIQYALNKYWVLKNQEIPRKGLNFWSLSYDGRIDQGHFSLELVPGLPPSTCHSEAAWPQAMLQTRGQGPCHAPPPLPAESGEGSACGPASWP